MQASPPSPATTQQRERTPARSAWLVSLALPLAAALAAHPALSRVDAHLAGEGGAALALCTAVLCFALVRFGLGARSLGFLMVRLSVGGAILGSVNAGAVLAASAMASHGPSISVPGAFLLGSTVGSIFGAPLGLVFGTAFLPSVWQAVQSRLNPSQDSFEGTCASVGATLVCAGLACGAVTRELSHLGALGTVLAGVALLLVALVRDARRMGFVREVRAGQRPEFRLRSPALDESPDVLPLFRTSEVEAADELLEQVSGHGVGPFREGAHRTVVASLHSQGLAVRSRLPLAALALAVAALGLLLLESIPDVAHASRTGSYHVERMNRLLRL